MVSIACYMQDSKYENLYPTKWPQQFPVKPEIGDKIESLDGKEIGVITDIIYKCTVVVYAECHLSRKRICGLSHK